MNWGLCSGAEREFPNIDILKTSSAEEENILGNIASSAEEENILGNIGLSLHPRISSSQRIEI